MSLQTRIKAAGAAAAAAPVDVGRRRAVKRRTKRAVMDRMGYDEVARISAYIDPALARSELRPAVEAALNVEEPTDLATPERETIIDEILDDVVGLGPLQPLIEDDTVTEIMINGCRSAFFERGGVLYPIEHAFEDDEQIRVLIDRIISPLGRRIDERSPIVNARLKTGYRVNAVIPPVAIDGPILTIRKFSDRICSLDELVGLGSLPLWYAQLLSCAVSLRQDLAVAGGTGSGKTTLLNALSCEISTGERIVTIEDSAELKFAHHPHVVRLEAREASIEGEGAVTIRDLVTNALRMRPDRIVVGEVRGAECCDMLQAMNTGHDGSLTTLHAGSEQETVVRLTLLARYGIDLPSELIEEQIAMALDGIVMSERHADGRRFVSSYSGVRPRAAVYRSRPAVGDAHTRGGGRMEITVPLVVGGLAGLSVATACGAEPRVPQVPPAELARQALETVAEKLPRELVENDLLKKIARSWASLAPAHRLGLVIEDASGRLAFLLLSSGVCCVLLTMVSLSPLGFALGLVAPFAVGAARDGFESRREQHDAEEAMPEAFTALSMSLASGHSLAQGMRFVGAHAQEPVHTEFLRVAAAIDCGISATDALDDLLVRIDAPGLSLVTLALKVSQRTGAPLADLLSEASSMVGERIELKRRLDVKTSQARMSAHMVAAMPTGMCAVLALLSADFRRGLATPAGAGAVVLGLALNAVALVVIRRIMRVEL